jgi:hypothetical protein
MMMLVVRRVVIMIAMTAMSRIILLDAMAVVLMPKQR